MVGVAVEPSHRVRVICSAHHAELYQCFQRSINRRPRNAGNTVSNIFKELIRGGMIFAVEHGLEDNSPLDRVFGKRCRRQSSSNWVIFVCLNVKVLLSTLEKDTTEVSPLHPCLFIHSEGTLPLPATYGISALKTFGIDKPNPLATPSP